jgi:hypothetical protein
MRPRANYLGSQHRPTVRTRTCHDTSVAMIERNYSRYITDHADALVRGAMLDLTPRDKPKLAVIG